MFARHGSTQQKDSLIAFAYDELPALAWAYLYNMATGQP